MKTQRTIYLLYQAGLANVFAVTPGHRPTRLLQSDFRACENFARGMSAAGERVRTRACNRAGDITRQNWTSNLENQPFSDKFSPVNSHPVIET
jgi:hypothetical protein